MAYIETPRTDAGDATFMTNGHNLEDFSVENSFVAPQKRNNDLLQQMRKGRGPNLKTPRSRNPLADRRNPPHVSRSGEFTPLLKSVAKSNLTRNIQSRGVPETPAFLKNGYKGADTPVLPGVESSRIYGEETRSLAGVEGEATPVPPVASSSEQSTPLALPERDAGGVLTADGNVMTLREQENIINKIEKENFGLKLKIHFLDETLKKAGPGYNAAALKENTDLKVDKITMQKELAHARKTLTKTERELEQYRLHLQEVQKDIQRKHLDEDLRQELESLRVQNAAKNSEIKELRHKTSTVDIKVQEVEKLRGEVEDLEADLREKDRSVEDREDEIDRLKERIEKDSDELNDIREELESEKKRNDQIENEREDVAQQAEQLSEAQQALKQALDAKKQAEHDLEELQDEMANKSMHTKGLSRQLEQKADKLESDLAALRRQNFDLQSNFDSKEIEAKKLAEKVLSIEQQAEAGRQQMEAENTILRNKHNSTSKRSDSLANQLQRLEDELRAITEDKDLLHSRHDTLTAESQSLQKDLLKARSRISELEENLDDERQHALNNDRQLRDEAKAEINRLANDVAGLQQELDARISEHSAQQDRWESQLRDLRLERERADERAHGLQRTVSKLQETEGTLSNRESKLQQALESEKTRHHSETALLERQIEELKNEISEKRQVLEDLRSELAQSNDDLRIGTGEQAVLEEKVQALEDEIEVLQNGLDDEVDNARKELDTVQQEADSLQRQLYIAKQELSRLEASQGEMKAQLTSFQERADGRSGSEQSTARLEQLETQLQQSRSEKQSLQDRLATNNLELHAVKTSAAAVEADRDGLKSQLQHIQSQVAQLEEIQGDLKTARGKEATYVQRDIAQKDSIRELKQNIARLERQIHDFEVSRLAVDSPKSSIGGSARKTELLEVRHQLTDTRQQLKDLRTKARDNERSLQQRLLESERQAQSETEAHDQQREQLETELTTCRHEISSHITKSATAEKTITRLRTRIANLESSLHDARAAANPSEDKTMADERADLHEMLKDAKLTAEDLQLQISTRQSLLDAATAREKDLRAQLKRIRDERSLQTQKSSALASELDSVQASYEAALAKLSRKQQQWDEERKAIVSRVRFTNMSVSERGDESVLGMEKRHAAELKGLAKQIQWLRARLGREEGFRDGLVNEKRWLTLRCDMYEACNKIDLELLTKMGCAPPKQALSTKEKKGGRFKVVATMVLASCRMKKMAGEWREQKKLKASLVKGLENWRRDMEQKKKKGRQVTR